MAGLFAHLRGYSVGDLRADVLAGATVTFVLIPQAVAYATLAGLPPIMGLYAAFLPAIVYALIGTSRHMAVGPVAIVCLLISSGLSAVAVPGTPEYDQAATTLALMVAAAFFVLALIRAGFLVNFLSHPTIVGFNAAAGILTALSQVRGFFGIPREAVPGLTSTNPWPVFLHLGDAHLTTLALGGVALAALLALSRWAPRLPGVLIVSACGVLLTWALSLDAAGVGTVGAIERGLPVFALTTPSLEQVRELIPAALTIVVVGYAASITVVKALAAQGRDRIQPNRELWAFSAANAASAVSGGFPVAGALARASVMAQAGSHTQVAGLLAGLSVVGVLAFMGPVFRFLPDAVLAAIVIKAAVGLINVPAALSIFKTKRSDIATLGLTFAVTLFVSLESGLLVGISLALVAFVYRTTTPHCAELGRIVNADVYRNVSRFDVETCPQVCILRIDAPLYYANARFLEDTINRLFAERPDMRVLMLDCASVNDMDATAIESLRRVIGTLRANGNDLHFVQLIGPVRDLIDRSGLGELIGEAQSRTILEAAPKVMAQIRRAYCEGTCRARGFPACDRIPRRGDPLQAAEAARFSPQI